MQIDKTLKYVWTNSMHENGKQETIRYAFRLEGDE